jgi:hypothetical protein
MSNVLEAQRAKEFAALEDRLAAIVGSSTLSELTERTDRAFDAVDELYDCGLIGGAERKHWGEEFSYANKECLLAMAAPAS